MQRAIANELETLGAALLERKWAARVGLVTEGGEVVAIAGEKARTRGAPASISEGPDDEPEAHEPLPDGLTALVVVASVDEQRWIYADVGSVRLLARLAEPAHEPEATAWLTQALERRGISVEHEPAQRE